MIIYYLDDELALCDIFKAYLSDEQTQVETFSIGSDAIAACKLKKPDLMFIDYRLSETSGDQVARALDPAIPKVLVTGELDLSVDDLFLTVIAKPYKLKSIKVFVESFNTRIIDISTNSQT